MSDYSRTPLDEMPTVATKADADELYLALIKTDGLWRNDQANVEMLLAALRGENWREERTKNEEGPNKTLGDYILTELDILEKGLRALLCQWRGGGVK